MRPVESIWYRNFMFDLTNTKKRYDEAISVLNKSVEFAPDYAVNIYNRGCVYCLMGDEANALADLRKAISLNPQFKSYAPKDEDFKSLWDNEIFKKLTSQ